MKYICDIINMTIINDCPVIPKSFLCHSCYAELECVRTSKIRSCKISDLNNSNRADLNRPQLIFNFVLI